MELLIGFVIILILWFVGVLACTILPILALDRFARGRSRPKPQEFSYVLQPPKPPRVEQPLPRAKPRGPDTAGYWQKWDGTYKWVVAQDKNAWDREFKAAEERAEPPRVVQPVPPPVQPKPLPQPQPAAPSEVFAKLRSRLGQLD